MSWMAPCDELGDRREPVGLGNSVGSNADAALTFKAGHGRVVNEPLDRAAREPESRCSPKLHCVDRRKTDSRQALYAGIPPPLGLSGVTFAIVKNAGVRSSSGGRILCPKNVLQSSRHR